MPTTKEEKKTKKATKKVTVAKKTVKVTKTPKKEIISAHAKHDKDTGSAKVQVAILTNRINELTEHLKEHKKDASSRRGLLKMVGLRRRLLNYIKAKMPEEYTKLIQELSLRK